MRATPLACGKSPAELYLKRQIRIRLDAPALRPYKPTPNPVTSNPVRHLKEGKKVIAKTYSNNKPEWKRGTVLRKLGKLHYQVKLENGHTLKRYIDQLRATAVATPKPTTEAITQGKATGKQGRVTFREEPDLTKYDFVHQPDFRVPSQPPGRPMRSRTAPQRFKDYIIKLLLFIIPSISGGDCYGYSGPEPSRGFRVRSAVCEVYGTCRCRLK